MVVYLTPSLYSNSSTCLPSCYRSDTLPALAHLDIFTIDAAGSSSFTAQNCLLRSSTSCTSLSVSSTPKRYSQIWLSPKFRQGSSHCKFVEISPSSCSGSLVSTYSNILDWSKQVHGCWLRATKARKTKKEQVWQKLKYWFLSGIHLRIWSSLNKAANKCSGPMKIQAEAPSPDPQEVKVKSNEDGVSTDGNVQSPAIPLSHASVSSTLGNLPSPNGSIGVSKRDVGPFLSITVLGATGDLARHKIFPALFALYYSGNLPKNVGIFGYSRSALSDDELRNMISECLTCRIDQQENCGEKMEAFLQTVYYEHGGYSGCEGMEKLNNRLQQAEVTTGAPVARVDFSEKGTGEANRIFYLSVPPEVVPAVANCLSTYAQSKKGWTRLIVEKPFGSDSESSARFTQSLLSRLREDQIYRIDHHLGKELIENLTILRFSNLVFEPLWSRTYIRNVQVILAEDWGMEGRGRYFDQHGVIRDIVQSHILQTIALFAMEPPVSLDGEDIHNEKVKVLRSMRKLTLHDMVLGQYKASISKNGKSEIPGYLDEPGVNPNSLTPTFVAAALYIDNARWDGVPFLIKAGSGLIKHKVEIRIQFRHVPGNLYRDRFGYNIDMATNELIIAVHPDEAIFLKINNKVPGLGLQLDSSELNLLYRNKYDHAVTPDSYEQLILDVIDGDNHLFIRGDELEATWELLTPLLKDIEKYKVAPELYTFGGRGPIGAYYLGAKHGVRWADD